ncbi:MAG: secretin N-terminal domain-containing protein [Desulfobacterales bacterium]|jgi:type II secretory pathway component GspD/PulD (secretin)
MSRHFFIIFIILNLTFVLYGLSIAQKAKTVGGRMVVCVVQLEHADAEYLASILEPFLSPEGSIVPYVTTNAIIIKDRQPVVDMLTKLIKGKLCSPISQSSGAKMRDK